MTTIPGWVPLIGGEAGADVQQFCAGIKMSGGGVTGSLSGGADLDLGGHGGHFNASGSASFSVCPLKLTSAHATLSGNADFPATFPNWPVPGVTAEIAFKPALSISAGIQESSGTWHFQSALGTFTPAIEGSLKAGADWAASATGTLGVVGNMTVQLPGNPQDCCLSQDIEGMNGTLYASVQGCVIGLCKEEKFSWNFWNCGTVGAASVIRGANENGNVQTWDSGWTRNCRDYLKSPAGYMRPAGMVAHAMSAGPERVSSTGAEQQLIQNMYPNAFPRLATNGNQATLVYCYDTDTTGASQDLQIGAMQYNGGAWATISDVTGTTYPNVEPWITYDSAGKPVCVWVGLPAATGQETDPTQLFPEMEIYASSYNGSAWLCRPADHQ